MQETVFKFIQPSRTKAAVQPTREGFEKPRSPSPSPIQMREPTRRQDARRGSTKLSCKLPFESEGTQKQRFQAVTGSLLRG